ncbi:hypothetical protein ACJJTC_014146 [Scirpophaga incertulas]
MESRIMNVPYHQASYSTISHNIMRSTSESLSSESSSNQDSPEYNQENYDEHTYDEESDESNIWQQNEQVSNTMQTPQQDSSTDMEEQIDVSAEIHYAPVDTDPFIYDQYEDVEDTSLIEGHDYDIITVYAVDPNTELEASSDEEQETYKICNNDDINVQCIDPKELHNCESQDKVVQDNSLLSGNTCIEAEAACNVDDYFIKSEVLDIKDDINEYFVKNSNSKELNIEDFINTHKVIEEPHITLLSKVDDLLVNHTKDVEHSVKSKPQLAGNEPVVEALPNIEDVKRFLMEDLPCPKLRNLQRSCSLPQSPMNIVLEDDVKTSLCFEDLNLDLSDLTFDKDKGDHIGNRSDDVLHTLTEEDVNSFLIPPKTSSNFKPELLEFQQIKNEDDFSQQEMEIENPVESVNIHETLINISEIERHHTITPLPEPVLKYCVEKTSLTNSIKKDTISVKRITDNDVKLEVDDFIDVESYNDTVVPVLEANNLNSLLEQFEATEKLNKKVKRSVIKNTHIKTKNSSKSNLTNGMRLQDAGIQLHKNKMRQILMPSTIDTSSMRRSPSPLHSDHDYCTSKKRHSLPNLKSGQSLLKPEVLSSNNQILNSRHRSCKNKKKVYDSSSDEESDTKKNISKSKKSNKCDSDVKFKKLAIKQPVKPIAQSKCRKKLSPQHSVPDNLVMNTTALEACDISYSQSNGGSIKLTIKNKSKVILYCDDKDSHKIKCKENHKISENCKPGENIEGVENHEINENYKSNDNLKSSSPSNKSSSSEKSTSSAKNNKSSQSVKDGNSEKCSMSIKDIKETNKNKKDRDRHKKHEHSNEKEGKDSAVVSVGVKKEETREDDSFYTALFPNKQDVKVPSTLIKTEKSQFGEELERINLVTIKKEIEQPPKKKKLNIQEYKMRRGVHSNNSSATVSPEAIFPEAPNLNIEKSFKPYSVKSPLSNITLDTKGKTTLEPKKVFDPIREASRKILLNTKKQKAEAMRRRDEDIVMSKIPKVENLQLQPLISDADLLKIVGGISPANDDLNVPIVPERPQASANYEEIILVSVGVNTEEDMFKKVTPLNKRQTTPTPEAKSLINFKIKKNDPVLKQNIFDTVKEDKRNLVKDKKKTDAKIDTERYKGITATLKSVERQVETKISSNSLFASIQDVVLKKASEESPKVTNEADVRSIKLMSSGAKMETFKPIRTEIIRDYDVEAEHGEDKVILHLGKDRIKPVTTSAVVQTEISKPHSQKSLLNATSLNQEAAVNRKRTDSDMSMSSDEGTAPSQTLQTVKDKFNQKSVVPNEPRIEKHQQRYSKERQVHSKDKYDSSKYWKRSRSKSRRPRRTRSRSRSHGHYRRHRRSVSPYRRKRRSRSPYHRRSPPNRCSQSNRRSSSKRRSPSNRRSPSSRRSNCDRRSPVRRSPTRRSKSPAPKKIKLSPQNSIIEKATTTTNRLQKSTTPPLRKTTVSESSDSSTSDSRESASSNRFTNVPAKNKFCSSYSTEDRDNNTPVEERRIVFVGKLEKEATKYSLKTAFSKFGLVVEVRIHNKEDGTKYGFVTYQRALDAWTAVESAAMFPQYDVGFGGRRAFCRQSYSDLDGLEAKYTESAFHGQVTMPSRRNDMTFEQMLLEMKNKLNQRKTELQTDDKS